MSVSAKTKKARFAFLARQLRPFAITEISAIVVAGLG